jgi:hypothetical protein
VSDQVSHPYMLPKLYLQFPLRTKCSCRTALSLLELWVPNCQSSGVTVCGVHHHFRSLDSFFKQGAGSHPVWSCIKTTFSVLSKGRVCWRLHVANKFDDTHTWLIWNLTVIVHRQVLYRVQKCWLYVLLYVAVKLGVPQRGRNVIVRYFIIIRPTQHHKCSKEERNCEVFYNYTTNATPQMF